MAERERERERLVVNYLKRTESSFRERKIHTPATHTDVCVCERECVAVYLIPFCLFVCVCECVHCLGWQSEGFRAPGSR